LPFAAHQALLGAGVKNEFGPPHRKRVVTGKEQIGGRTVRTHPPSGKAGRLARPNVPPRCPVHLDPRSPRHLGLIDRQPAAKPRVAPSLHLQPKIPVESGVVAHTTAITVPRISNHGRPLLNVLAPQRFPAAKTRKKL